MIVWTRQNKKVLEILEKNDTYFCKEEYIDKKMENFSDYYKKLYSWYAKRAEEISAKPKKEIKYPIWVSIDEKIQLQPVEGQIILKLSIEPERLVITDMDKWSYVVNFLYLPLSGDDYKEHKKLLKKYNISDPIDLITGDLGNFYPRLKNKIEKSWERLFDDYRLSPVSQGTIWEIKSSDIIEII